VAREVKVAAARGIQLSGILDPSHHPRIPIPVVLADATTQDGAGLAMAEEIAVQVSVATAEIFSQTEPPATVDHEQQFRLVGVDVGVDHKPETRDFKWQHRPWTEDASFGTEVGMEGRGQANMAVETAVGMAGRGCCEAAVSAVVEFQDQDSACLIWNVPDFNRAQDLVARGQRAGLKGPRGSFAALHEALVIITLYGHMCYN